MPRRSRLHWCVRVANFVLAAALLDGSSLLDEAEASRRFDLSKTTPLLSNVTNPVGVILPADGLNLYAVESGQPRLVVFRREVGTGALTALQSVDAAPSTHFGNGTASADGAHVYVPALGSPANPNGLLLVYDRSPLDGTLTLIQSLEPAIAANPADLVISPDGLHVYGSSSARIALFHRDTATGFLTEGTRDHVGTYGPLAISPDGASLYGLATGAYVPGGIQTFSRDSATGLVTLIDTDDAGQVGYANLPKNPALSPDGKFLYAVAQNSLYIFSRDLVTGDLSLVDTETDGVDGIDGLRSVHEARVSPDGLFLYVTSNFIACCLIGGDKALSTFSRDTVTGAVTFLSKDASASTEFQTARRLRLTADGAHIYVTNHLAKGIETFSRDAVTGLPTRESGIFGFEHATSVVEAAGGSHIYAAGPEFDGVIGLSRDAVTGDLTQVTQAIDTLGSVTGLADAHDLALSPDERHLYVVSPTAHAVVAFERALGTGALSWIETETNGAGGVSDLAGARAVHVSADGLNVYVAAHDDDAIAVFARDLATGELSFVGAAVNGVSGVEGLDGANSLVTSPDGLHLYAASAIDDAVAVFARSDTSGTLSLLQVLRDGVLDVDGIDGASSVLLSADGRFLYVSGVDEPGIGVFTRDLVSGLLTQTDSEIDGILGSQVPPGDALQNSRGIVLSPNEELLVAVSHTERVWVSFRRDPATGSLAFIQEGTAFFLPSPHGARTAWISPDQEEILLVGGVGTFFANALTESVACPITPLATCRTAPLGNINIRTHPIGSKKKLKWLWAKGEATSVPEFDPGLEPYRLCGYDESRPTSKLTLEAYIPADVDCTKKDNEKPCWKTGDVVATYKHDLATPDGVGSIKLVSGETGKAKIKLKGNGTNVLLPPLPMALPYRVQLVGPTGLCWEAAYSTPKKNDEFQFKANVDVP